MIDGSPFLYAGNGRRFMDEILIKAGGFLFMIALGFLLKRIGLFSGMLNFWLENEKFEFRSATL